MKAPLYKKLRFIKKCLKRSYIRQVYAEMYYKEIGIFDESMEREFNREAKYHWLCVDLIDDIMFEEIKSRSKK
jgi:hypothetical protein